MAKLKLRKPERIIVKFFSDSTGAAGKYPVKDYTGRQGYAKMLKQLNSK